MAGVAQKFESLKSPFGNSKGQAILTAIIVSLSAGLMTGYLLHKAQEGDELLRAPRIRSAMISAQAKLRLLSMQPTSYRTTGCPGGVPVCLRPGMEAQIQELMPGAECLTAPSTLCGVKVEPPGLTFQTDPPVPPSTRPTNHIRGNLIYDGKEFEFKKVPIDVLVPNDTLQMTAGGDCYAMDPTKPVFAGLKPDNQPDCKPIPGFLGASPKTDCSGPGEYVVSVNPYTMALTCGTLPASFSCDTDEYMTNLRWGPTGLIFDCEPRPSPLTRLGFTQARNVVVDAWPEAPRPAGTCVGVPVAGVCGVANGQTLAAPPPLANRCSAGSSTAVVGGASGPWTWTCRGVFGSTTNASCSAATSVAPPAPACGVADGTTRATAPASGLCSVGTASAVTGTGPWNWTCTSGTSTASCSASTAASACQIQYINTVTGATVTMNMTAGQSAFFIKTTPILSATPNLIFWTTSTGARRFICPTSTCTCWRFTCESWVTMHVPLSDYPDQPTCKVAGARDACVSGTEGCSAVTCADEMGVCP